MIAGQKNEKLSNRCVGILCGSGQYPELVARSCVCRHQKFCVVHLCEHKIHEEVLKTDFCISTESIEIGAVGSILNFLHNNNIDKVVFAGAIKRPNFNRLKLDGKGASWMLKLGKKIFSGDDELLRGLTLLMEQEGFDVLSGTDIIGDIFVPHGVLSNIQPSKIDYENIEIGLKAAKTLGALDIGQAVVVHNGIVLGVEAVEGTNDLIKRCAILRNSDFGGILIKASKPQQDTRVDLPTVGPETINLLNFHGFLGLAVEAEKCIVINKELMISQVNDFSMFFCGHRYIESSE